MREKNGRGSLFHTIKEEFGKNNYIINISLGLCFNAVRYVTVMEQRRKSRKKHNLWTILRQDKTDFTLTPPFIYSSKYSNKLKQLPFSQTAFVLV